MRLRGSKKGFRNEHPEEHATRKDIHQIIFYLVLHDPEMHQSEKTVFCGIWRKRNFDL